MRGTNIYYLSGIENAQSVWLGDYPEMQSPGKFVILSEIDLLIETANITTNQVELANIYNKLDLMVTLLYGYEFLAKGSKSKFIEVCKIVSEMNAQNLFSNSNTDLEFRKSNLDILQKKLKKRKDLNEIGNSFDSKLYGWLEDNVINEMTFAISGNNTGKSGEVAKGIKDAGPFFLYRYLSPSQLRKTKNTVHKKLKVQNATHGWVAEHNKYFNRRSQDNFIRSGIIAQSGMTPEQLIRYMAYKQANFKQIGSITLATVYSIVQIVGVLISIVSVLVKIFGKKRNPPSKEEMSKSFASGADMDGLISEDNPTGKPKTGNGNNTGNNTGNDTNNSLEKNLPLIVGAGILFFATKNT